MSGESSEDTEQCPVCGWEGIVATKVVDGTAYYSHLIHTGGRVRSHSTCKKNIHTGRTERGAA